MEVNSTLIFPKEFKNVEVGGAVHTPIISKSVPGLRISNLYVSCAGKDGIRCSGQLIKVERRTSCNIRALYSSASTVTCSCSSKMHVYDYQTDKKLETYKNSCLSAKMRAALGYASV